MTTALVFPIFIPTCLTTTTSKLGMSEEEIVSLLNTNISALKQISAEEASSPNWALLFSRFLSSGLFPTPKTIPETTGMSIIPLKNEQGNATAVGSMYCAVNANTQHPDEAAFIVEYLLTEECQETRKIFRIHNAFGMPSMLINKNARVEGDTQLTPATRESWEMACSQISRVYFPSPVDTELNNMLKEIQLTMRNNYSPDAGLYDFIKGDISEEKLREIVHEYYGKISRLLEEA